MTFAASAGIEQRVPLAATNLTTFASAATKVRNTLHISPRSALRSTAALMACPLVWASLRSGRNSSEQGGPPACPPPPPPAGPPPPPQAGCCDAVDAPPPGLPHC